MKIEIDVEQFARDIKAGKSIGYLYKKKNNYPMAKKYFMEVITKLEVYCH